MKLEFDVSGGGDEGTAKEALMVSRCAMDLYTTKLARSWSHRAVEVGRKAPLVHRATFPGERMESRTTRG
jgi:hypothetical protein